MISKDEALEIARQDASSAYADLTIYAVKITSQDGNWRDDYEITDPNLQGGGPHYVISGATGEIASRRYEQ